MAQKRFQLCYGLLRGVLTSTMAIGDRGNSATTPKVSLGILNVLGISLGVLINGP